MKILLLSGYDAVSHIRWRELLVESFSEHDWTILSLPARHFSWRIRGNSLSWAFEQRNVLTQQYDLLIATSMVDLSSLRGFVPELSQCPTLVYFHENQFAYPNSGHQVLSVESQIVSLYTALTADKIVFNSRYNQDTFLHGVDKLLGKMPDHVPVGLINKLAACSSIVPVPLEKECFIISQVINTGPLAVVWNHRWEYDKAPERLFAAIKGVLEQGIDIHLFIVGQQFRQQPPVFEQMLMYLQAYYPNALKHWGFVGCVRQYRSILAAADVVLSTALHDFQGLSVLEAVAAGCIPVVPNRLCYGQWFSRHYLYDSNIESSEQEVQVLIERITQLATLKLENKLPAVPDISNLCVSSLEGNYQQIFAETIDRHSQQLV